MPVLLVYLVLGSEDVLSELSGFHCKSHKVLGGSLDSVANYL